MTISEIYFGSKNMSIEVNNESFEINNGKKGFENLTEKTAARVQMN